MLHKYLLYCVIGIVIFTVNINAVSYALVNDNISEEQNSTKQYIESKEQNNVESRIELKESSDEKNKFNYENNINNELSSYIEQIISIDVASEIFVAPINKRLYLILIILLLIYR